MIEIKKKLTLDDMMAAFLLSNKPCEKYKHPRDCSGEGLNFTDMCFSCQEYWNLTAEHHDVTPQEILDDFRGPVESKEVVN